MTLLIDRLIEEDNKSPRRIVFIGDAMTDVYVYGRLENTCQEECPKFIEESHVCVRGGAANASRSLDNWSVKKTNMFNMMAAPIKTRFMIEGKYIFRHDNDYHTKLNVNVAHTDIWNTLMRESFHGVLISDYDKGLLTPEFIQVIIRLCNDRYIPCVSDVKREPSVYRGSILKGNAKYFSKYAEQARTMTSRAVTTYGDVYPLIWDRGNVYTSYYSPDEILPAVSCVNHIGAGDCFAAHLIFALAHSFSLKEAAAIAHSAGRVYVQHKHNRPPLPEEIRADMLLSGISRPL